MIRSYALLSMVLLVSCASSARTMPERASSSLSYRFVLEPGLEAMHVEVCPSDGGWLPARLTPIHDAGRARLSAAELVVNGTSTPLAIDGAISLDGAPRGACARYAIDLRAAALMEGPSQPVRVGDDLFAPTSAWLLAPSPRDPMARHRARFELPDGIDVSPFWPSDDEGTWFDERAFSFVTYAAFGDLEIDRVGVPGGCADVVSLDGALGVDREARARWIFSAASASARVTGDFPAERATLLLVPATTLSAQPVLYGIAGRGVRPTVTLLVAGDATIERLVPDWTLVHELSHLLTGYAHQEEDTWLAEGIATYYEEVLRARSGLITEQQAWQALADGFRRGSEAEATTTLREASRRMHASRAYGRVYWAGAAIAFRADVAYRRAGSSLDEAVARAWARREERMTGDALMRALDGTPDGPFAIEARAALDSVEFPSVDEAFEWLGVDASGATLTLDPTAEGSAARRALMNDSPTLASIPADCDER